MVVERLILQVHPRILGLVVDSVAMRHCVDSEREGLEYRVDADFLSIGRIPRQWPPKGGNPNTGVWSSAARTTPTHSISMTGGYNATPTNPHERNKDWRPFDQCQSNLLKYSTLLNSSA